MNTQRLLESCLAVATLVIVIYFVPWLPLFDLRYRQVMGVSLRPSPSHIPLTGDSMYDFLQLVRAGQVDVNTWETYTNIKYGFEIKYPLGVKISGQDKRGSAIDPVIADRVLFSAHTDNDPDFNHFILYIDASRLLKETSPCIQNGPTLYSFVNQLRTNALSEIDKANSLDSQLHKYSISAVDQSYITDKQDYTRKESEIMYGLITNNIDLSYGCPRLSTSSWENHNYLQNGNTRLHIHFSFNGEKEVYARNPLVGYMRKTIKITGN